MEEYTRIPHRPSRANPRMSMKRFWYKLANLRSKGWVAVVADISGPILLLAPRGDLTLGWLDPVQAVAHDERKSFHDILNHDCQIRIQDAAGKCGKRSPRHKKTRVKLLRALGLKEKEST